MLIPDPNTVVDKRQELSGLIGRNQFALNKLNEEAGGYCTSAYAISLRNHIEQLKVRLKALPLFGTRSF